MNKTVCITIQVYEKMLKTHRNRRIKKTLCFLVSGTKLKETIKINDMIKLETGTNGCSEMPNIHPSQLSLGMSKLYRLKKNPIGLMRIGDFDDVFDYERGDVVEDLYDMTIRGRNKKYSFLFISFCGNDLAVEDVRSPEYRLNWAIVK